MKKELVTQTDLRKELVSILSNDKSRQIQAKKKAMPSAPKNEVTIGFRCSQNGKAFAVTYKELSLSRYKLVSINKAGKDSNTHAHGINIRDIDIRKLPFADWYCPWCSKFTLKPRTNFIKCGVCNEYICSAKSTEYRDGRLYFRCHEGCGAEDFTQDALFTLRAQKSSHSAPMHSPSAIQNDTKLLNHNTGEFLRITKE